MSGWLLVALGLLLLPWVAGPLLVRFTQRQQAHPIFEPIDPATAQAPSDLWPFFSATMRALHAEGFLTAGYLVQRGSSPNVEAWVLMLERRESQEAAIAVGMYSTLQSVSKLQAQYVEFSASWEDGTSVSVGNSPVPSLFPSVPGVLSLHLPELADPLRVLAAHRALVKRHGSRAARQYPAAGEFQRYLELSMERELARNAGTDYLELMAGGQHYRPTWRGSLLMPWKLLWPVSAIRKSRWHRRNLRLIAELGV